MKRSGVSMLSTSGWSSLFMRLCKHWHTPNETNEHHIAILANVVHTLEQLSFINIHTVREEARGCKRKKNPLMHSKKNTLILFTQGIKGE